jgi:hypothetical protein
MRQAKNKIKKDLPVVRSIIQRGSRNVVRSRVIVENSNVREGVITKERECGHVEQLYLWSAEDTSRVAWILLPKPEEDLNTR